MAVQSQLYVHSCCATVVRHVYTSPSAELASAGHSKTMRWRLISLPATWFHQHAYIHTYIHTCLLAKRMRSTNVWRAFCALIGHVDSLGLPVSWVVVHRTGQGHHCFLLLVGNEVKISHGIASRLPRQFRFAACIPATASQSGTTCVCEYSIR